MTLREEGFNVVGESGLDCFENNDLVYDIVITKDDTMI